MLMMLGPFGGLCMKKSSADAHGAGPLDAQDAGPARRPWQQTQSN